MSYVRDNCHIPCSVHIIYIYFWTSSLDLAKSCSTRLYTARLLHKNKNSVCVVGAWWTLDNTTSSRSVMVSQRCLLFPRYPKQRILHRAMLEQIGVSLFGVGVAGMIHLLNLLHSARASVYYIVERDLARAMDIVQKCHLRDTTVVSVDDTTRAKFSMMTGDLRIFPVLQCDFTSTLWLSAFSSTFVTVNRIVVRFSFSMKHPSLSHV